MAVGDEPNIGGLGMGSRGPGGAFLLGGSASGHDLESEHRDIVRRLTELHDKYGDIVKKLQAVKKELKAIGQINLTSGGGAASNSYTAANMPAMPNVSGSGAAAGFGQPGGQGGGAANQGGAAGGQGGGGSFLDRHRVTGAVVAGVLGMSVGFHRRQAEGTAGIDMLRRQMMISGGMGYRQTESYLMQLQRLGGLGGQAGVLAASGQLQAGGLMPGTPMFTRMMTSAERMGRLRPDLAPEQLAQMMSSLQVGPVANQLGLRGIRSSTNQSPEAIMRNIVTYAFGGRSVTNRSLEQMRPGMPGFERAAALVGPEMAQMAFQQELSRRRGGKKLMDDSVLESQRAREGQAGSRLTDINTELAASMRRVNDQMATMNQTLSGLNNILSVAGNEIGGYTNAVGSVFNSLKDILWDIAALRGMGLLGNLGKGGAVLGKAKGLLGGAAAAGSRLLGVGRLATATAAGGAAVLGGGVGYLAGTAAKHATGGNRLAGAAGGALAGAGAGALLGAKLGSLMVPIPGIGTGVGALAGGIIGGLGGLFGDPHRTYSQGDASVLHERTHHPETAVHGMNPEFRRRLEAMFRDNPRLRLTSGYRSPQRQKELWDQAVRKYGSPEAARKWVAPPGKSNHEKGVAADIGPESEYGWLARNAPKYGLSPYAPEPWHWELSGVRDGSVGAFDLPQEGTARPGGAGAAASLGASGISAVPGLGAEKMSESEYIASILGTSATSSVSASNLRGATGPVGIGGTADTSSSPLPSGKGLLSPADIAKVAAEAGFSGNDLITAVAIALAESSGNPRASNKKGRDYSIGLWQINMLAHGKRFGSEAALHDPMKNAEAAMALFRESGFQPWSTYTGSTMHKGKNPHSAWLDEARQGARAAGIGDAPPNFAPPMAMPAPPMRAGTTVNINLRIDKATPNEAREFAKEVARILKEQEHLATIGGS